MPRVWIYTDMSDPTLPGTNHRGTVNDPDEVINVLCRGSLTEPAILVSHGLTIGNQNVLSKLRFIAHWTNSPLHQGSPEHPADVANCREDEAACRYMKAMAGSGKIVCHECGAIGQHDIVSGSPKGKEYFDQFRTNQLGTLFVKGKFVQDCVDHFDSATYWVLLGDYGVSLKDIAADGTNNAAIEKVIESRFAAASEEIHDELLRRSKIAAVPIANVNKSPNVLFIAMDDLNDWVGCMGGHPQTITPNLNRLAASGVLLT